MPRRSLTSTCRCRGSSIFWFVMWRDGSTPIRWAWDFMQPKPAKAFILILRKPTSGSSFPRATQIMRPSWNAARWSILLEGFDFFYLRIHTHFDEVECCGSDVRDIEERGCGLYSIFGLSTIFFVCNAWDMFNCIDYKILLYPEKNMLLLEFWEPRFRCRKWS